MSSVSHSRSYIHSCVFRGQVFFSNLFHRAILSTCHVLAITQDDGNIAMKTTHFYLDGVCILMRENEQRLCVCVCVCVYKHMNFLKDSPESD